MVNIWPQILVVPRLLITDMNISSFSNITASSVYHSRVAPSSNFSRSFEERLATLHNANNLKHTNTCYSKQVADTFSFEKYINARVPTDNYVDGAYLLTRANCSPSLQCQLDYEDLKRAQANSELPAPLGSADDMAYLREHFSGELSDFQVCDAIETMRSMGIMSRYENNRVWGCRLMSVDLEHPVKTGPIEEWTDKFPADSADAPLFHFHTLDDILNWLTQIRKEPVPELEARWLDMLGESPFGAEI